MPHLLGIDTPDPGAPTRTRGRHTAPAVQVPAVATRHGLHALQARVHSCTPPCSDCTSRRGPPPLASRWRPGFTMAPIGADPMENIPLLGDVLQGLFLATQASTGPNPPPPHTGGLHAAVAFNTIQGHTHEHILLPCPHQERNTHNSTAQEHGYCDTPPRTWIPVYQSRLACLARPSTSQSVEDEGRPAFWLQWNKRTMLRFLMQLSPEAP